MNNQFNENAAEPKKSTYVVFTENLVDSLCAANAVKFAMAEAVNGEEANVYFVDILNTTHIEKGSDLERYAMNCHDYTQDDLKKACHVFQSQLKDKYDIDSECLTSAFPGGLQYALFNMFEGEDVNNITVICGEGMEEMAKSEIGMARSGPNGMKKHVEYEMVANEVPGHSVDYKVEEHCPGKVQYHKQL